MQKKSTKMDSNIIVLDSSDDEGNSHTTISRKNILKQRNGNCRLINPVFLEKNQSNFVVNPQNAIKLQLSGSVIRSNEVNMHKLAETDADISQLLDNFIDEQPDCLEELAKEDPSEFFESDNAIVKSSTSNNKRKHDVEHDLLSTQRKIRRVAPTRVSCTVTNTCLKDGGGVGKIPMRELEDSVVGSDDDADDITTVSSIVSSVELKPIHPTFQYFLDACREADPSRDMDTLINNRILRYYNQVHTDFTNSKSFGRNVSDAIQAIKQNKSLVYLKIKPIVEELRIRRKAVVAAVDEAEEPLSPEETESLHKITRLNSALTKLNRRIKKMEEAEVNLDDDQNSIYMVVSRCKKRAALIYDKICDLTGESKNACRLVRKPLTFNGTPYTEFNKKIQTFVNKSRRFPDYSDVLRTLRHCNGRNEYHLTEIDMKKVAQDAFQRIGKSLQKRRRTDLYETVSFFSGSNKDPALEDAALMAKLDDNKKFQKRIGEIIDKFAKEQDIQKTVKKNGSLVDEFEASTSRKNKDETTDGSSSSLSPANSKDSPIASTSGSLTHIILSDDDDDSEKKDVKFVEWCDPLEVTS